MNVAMADGSLADAEGKAIKAGAERAISPYSADEKERLKKIYNESLKSSYLQKNQILNFEIEVDNTFV